jgi:hypothetical protein
VLAEQPGRPARHAQFFGGGVNVTVTIATWSILRAARHPITVGRETLTSSAIAVSTPLRSQQHNPRPLRKTCPHRRRPHQPRQLGTIIGTQHQRGSRTIAAPQSVNNQT